MANRLAQKRGKSSIFAVPLAVAALFICVVFLLQGIEAIPTQQQSDRVDDAFVYIVVFCILLTAWACSVSLRCSHKAIRRNLTIIAALLVFFLVLALVKYPERNPYLVTAYWYLYYLPFLYVPLLFFYCGLHVAIIERAEMVRKLKITANIITDVFFLLVLTNNFHHFVFVFDYANPSWQGDYAYGWGYWLVFAWIAALFLGFVVTLFVAARRQLRSALVPLLIFVCVGVTCCLFYALRVGGVFPGISPLAYTLFIALVLEFCLDFGLLPSYFWFGEAFRKLPLDLKLFDSSDEAVFQTDCAKPISRSLRHTAHVSEVVPDKSICFDSAETPFATYRAYWIPGGIALLTKDVSELVLRRNQLKERQKALQRQNLALKQSKSIQERLLRQKAEQDLFTEVENQLRTIAKKIQDKLASLPKGDDAASIAKRREDLMMIKLWVAYGKRKGALIFDGKSDVDFSRERLQLIMNETSSDVRTVGIDCASLVELDASLPTVTASVLYDCFYDLIEFAFYCQEPTLMFYVRGQASNLVEMNAVLELSGYKEGAPRDMLDVLRSTLEVRDVAYRLVEGDDMVRLTVLARTNEG